VAAAEPDTFVLGIDADAGAMAESSRRADRHATRGGVANSCFVASGVELLSADLNGLADRVTIRFPWGSLLRGALGVDREVAASIAALVAQGGRLEVTLSLVGRDRNGAGIGDFGEADLDRMTAVHGSLGLDRIEARRLAPDEVSAMRSSWARRLRAGRDRPVWLVSFVRRGQRPVG